VAGKTGAVTRKDMTQGNILKLLIPYTLPLILSNLLQTFYGLVDMMIAGHFTGASGLSAINNSSQITGILAGVAIGVSTGGTVIIGQFFGAKNKTGVKRSSGTIFSFSLLTGLGVCIMIYFVSEPLLRLLRAPSFDDAVIYLKICSVGMMPVFGYNALSGMLRAVGNSRWSLYFISASTATNIILDLVMIGPLGLGVAGAAIATVISQYVSFIFALLYLRRMPDLLELKRESLKIRGDLLRKILKVSIPTVIQYTVSSVSWLTVTGQLNAYGKIVSAGNGVSIKIKETIQCVSLAIAHAATSMIAQNLGAGEYDRAKEIMYTAMKTAVVIAAALIALVELTAPVLSGAFTSDAEVISASVLNLRIEIIGQLFYAIFRMHNALALGAGHALFPAASAFANCILFRMIFSILLNHWFGLKGLYVGCMIAPSIGIPLGIIYVRSKVWRKSLVSTGAAASEPAK